MNNNLIFVLVRPQMGENIGAAARAMLNCGFAELRIVNPRDGWPNDKARSNSSNADQVIDNAKVFSSIKDAVADCHFVLATTARARDQVKPVFTPMSAALEFRAQSNAGSRCAVLFGPERTGLENNDLAHADGLITIPLDPDYSSLNLAQAVLLVAWEYAKLSDRTNAVQLPLHKSKPATKAELDNLFERLESELQSAGFYTSAELKPTMIRNVRNFFMRATPTDQDVRTLHGIITALKNSSHSRPRVGGEHGNPET